jgi:CheY-like chemotaxis protein
MSTYVLFVEDNDDVRDVLIEVLQEYFRIISAKDGASALAALRAFPPPDLVITDLHLPVGAQGLEVAAMATQLDIPVLLITGDGQRAQELKAMGHDVLPKPFHVADFLGRIESAIDAAQKGAASPGALANFSLQLNKGVANDAPMF